MATEVPGDHPRRRALSRGVLSPIRAYSTPQARATPAIMRSFHPSTNGKHRVLASSPFRLRLSRPCHSDQTPRGTRSSCTCIRGAARARCARESGRLRESLREREREGEEARSNAKIFSRRRRTRFSKIAITFSRESLE